MTLYPGYNIVTERLGNTEEELTALEFFRKLTADESIESPVTVTGLEDLLYNASEDGRNDIIRNLRQVLRDTRSLAADDAVQLLIKGSIVEDNAFRIRIERGGEGIYLDVGQLFVEVPKSMGAKQFVARK